jgi:UDP-N-acetylglucosamine 2-epimerase
MEAGNRCFDERVPEELNRKIVDHLSDINMVLTEHARRYLISEGIRPETIIKTGSSMKQVFAEHIDEINKSNILKNLNIESKKYFVLSAHREENIDNENNFNNLVDTINKLSDYYNIPIVFSVHPRTRKKIKEKKIQFKNNVIFMKPLGFNDYNKLQDGCIIA